jgi:hypothetical protein
MATTAAPGQGAAVAFQGRGEPLTPTIRPPVWWAGFDFDFDVPEEVWIYQ